MTSTISALKPKKVPKPHQTETETFLLSHKRCYNLSDMGTGKTMPTARCIRMLYEYPALERILVVAPLSVLPSTWRDEMEEHAPNVPTMFLDVAHKRQKQYASLPGFKGVVLINPDAVVGAHKELTNWKPQLVVVDELAGFYRNTRTQRYKALRTLLALTKANIWAFTGSPVTNSVLDSYAQILLVNPEKMPRNRDGKYVSFVQYRDMLCLQPYPNTWVPKKDALQRVSEFMQPAIRFERKHVMKDVKEPIRLRKKIPLTPEQKKLYDQLVAAGKAEFGGKQIGAKEAQTLVVKLAQIVTGTVYASDKSVVEVPYTPRLQALLDLHEEVSYTPIIVAVPFIHTIHRVEADLVAKGKRVAVIIGDTAPSVRADIVRRFQAGEFDYLLCHPKTLSHGVTLTASHTVCWFGPLYDHELFAQLNARVTRYGQQGQPLQVELFSTEAESRVYASLHSKEKIAGKFLELFGD